MKPFKSKRVAKLTKFLNYVLLKSRLYWNHIRKATPQQTLNNITESYIAIAKSPKATNRMKTLASGCNNYASKATFQDEFLKLYNAKHGRIQDRLIKEKSRKLKNKTIDSASQLTGKAIDVLKENTLKELDDGKAYIYNLSKYRLNYVLNEDTSHDSDDDSETMVRLEVVFKQNVASHDVFINYLGHHFTRHH
jgi:hypothetical protein